MGLIINRHVRVHQVKMLEKAIEQCEKMEKQMALDLKRIKEKKSSLESQLEVQGKAVEKELKVRESAQKEAKKKKDASEKKALDVPKIKDHPDKKQDAKKPKEAKELKKEEKKG